MATKKFNRILQEFSERIGNRLDSAFDPEGGVAFPDGNLLDAVDAIAVVNKALHKHHNDIWLEVRGDKKAFIQIFPELIKLSGIMTFSSGIYTVITPHLDFFALYSGFFTDAIPYRIFDEEKLDLLETEQYPRHEPTASKPVLVALAAQINRYPKIDAVGGKMYYIVQPLVPSTGGFLVQNGADENDSPFYNTRNTAIAAIAEEIYWNEKQADRR